MAVETTVIPSGAKADGKFSSLNNSGEISAGNDYLDLQAEQNLKLLYLESQSAIHSDNYTTAQLDLLNAVSGGYDGTVNSGSTDAIFDSVMGGYTNFDSTVSGSQKFYEAGTYTSASLAGTAETLYTMDTSSAPFYPKEFTALIARLSFGTVYFRVRLTYEDDSVYTSAWSSLLSSATYTSRTVSIPSSYAYKKVKQVEWQMYNSGGAGGGGIKQMSAVGLDNPLSEVTLRIDVDLGECDTMFAYIVAALGSTYTMVAGDGSNTATLTEGEDVLVGFTPTYVDFTLPATEVCVISKYCFLKS